MLEVSPAAGWVPEWRDPCIVAVVVGSVAVSLLVLWLLVTREKHNMLLQAMLPEKVIWRLQRGEQTVVEEFLDPVTILFSDVSAPTCLHLRFESRDGIGLMGLKAASQHT